MPLIRIKPMHDGALIRQDMTAQLSFLSRIDQTDLSIVVEIPCQMFGNRYDVVAEVMVPDQWPLEWRQRLLNATHEVITQTLNVEHSQVFAYLKTYASGEVCDRGTIKHWQTTFV